MGSRSHPHRVLSVCVCVCVSRCLWVCVIEANSLQLRVITIGLYQFLSRSPSCQILAVCGRRLRGVSGSWFPRFLSPAAFLDSDRRRLVCPLLPCATRLSPYGKLRFCLRKAPLLPTESSASAYGKLRLCPTEAPPPPYGKLRLVSHCVLLLVINSLFPQLNPPVFIVTDAYVCSSLGFIYRFLVLWMLKYIVKDAWFQMQMLTLFQCAWVEFSLLFGFFMVSVSANAVGSLLMPMEAALSSLQMPELYRSPTRLCWEIRLSTDALNVTPLLPNHFFPCK